MVTREELEQIVAHLLEEMRSGGLPVIGGASTFGPAQSVATSCNCDGRCGCDARCGCNAKEGCACNARCPCDGKAAPAKSSWVINPDPTRSRVFVTLNSSESPDEMLQALRNVRAGIAAQAVLEVEGPQNPPPASLTSPSE